MNLYNRGRYNFITHTNNITLIITPNQPHSPHRTHTLPAPPHLQMQAASTTAPPTSPTPEPSPNTLLQTIHHTRDLLQARRHQLDIQRLQWEHEMRQLQQDEDALHATCTHPRQTRERSMAAYDETEYYCPDCGRLRVLG